MEKMPGYDEAQALTGEFESIEPGGYICKIINAKEEMSKSNKKMLVIAFDIAEGEHKDFYKRRYDELCKQNKDLNTKVKWPNNGVYRQMLEGENATSYLKGLMTSLEESNEKFKWDWDEKKLVGLLFGGIFGKEEYQNQTTGEYKMATKLRFVRTIKAVKEGKFDIPEDKKLPKENNNFNFVQGDSGDDLPF